LPPRPPLIFAVRSDPFSSSPATPPAASVRSSPELVEPGVPSFLLSSDTRSDTCEKSRTKNRRCSVSSSPFGRRIAARRDCLCGLQSLHFFFFFLFRHTRCECGEANRGGDRGLCLAPLPNRATGENGEKGEKKKTKRNREKEEEGRRRKRKDTGGSNCFGRWVCTRDGKYPEAIVERAKIKGRQRRCPQSKGEANAPCAATLYADRFVVILHLRLSIHLRTV